MVKQNFEVAAISLKQGNKPLQPGQGDAFLMTIMKLS